MFRREQILRLLYLTQTLLVNTKKLYPFGFTCSNLGFLNLSAIDMLGQTTLCCGSVTGIIGCWQHPWPLPVSSPFPSCDNERASRHCQCPLGSRINHWLTW